LAAPTTDVLDVTGRPAEDFETIAVDTQRRSATSGPSATAFARSAAYGDIIAAILALLALISLPSASGVVIAWIFSLWGTADLFNAFYQANQAGSGRGSWVPPISFRLSSCPYFFSWSHEQFRWIS